MSTTRTSKMQDKIRATLGPLNDSQQTARTIANRANVHQEENVNVTQNVNEIKKENKNVNVNENVNVNDDIKNKSEEVSESDIKTVKFVSFEEKHTRATFYIRKDVEQALNKLSKKGGKGFKTKFLNDAVIAELKRYAVEL